MKSMSIDNGVLYKLVAKGGLPSLSYLICPTLKFGQPKASLSRIYNGAHYHKIRATLNKPQNFGIRKKISTKKKKLQKWPKFSKMQKLGHQNFWMV